ncbi:MAG: ATP-binding protein [Phormidesmis sp.]
MAYNHEFPRTRNLYISGIPEDVSESESALYRSRIISATEKLLNKTVLEDMSLVISTLKQESENQLENTSKKKKARKDRNADDELKLEERAARYVSKPPEHTFEKLVFQDNLQSKIDYEMKALSALSIVHEVLNYKSIKPVQRRGLILGGEPGTGKTTLANAIADKAGLPILKVTAADIESKYHGEGTKNLKAAFYAAHRDSALLHIEEAESICSQRLDEASSGSEQSMNSLRNQLFTCLDEFPVPTILTTNAVDNLDKALATRLRYIEVPMPDKKCRQGIWDKCIKVPGKITVDKDVSINDLADVDDVCGREIADAVEDAALKSVIRAMEKGAEPSEASLTQEDLMSSILDARKRRLSISKGQTLTDAEKEEVGESLRGLLANTENEDDGSSDTTYVLLKNSRKIDDAGEKI